MVRKSLLVLSLAVVCVLASTESASARGPYYYRSFAPRVYAPRVYAAPVYVAPIYRPVVRPIYPIVPAYGYGYYRPSVSIGIGIGGPYYSRW